MRLIIEGSTTSLIVGDKIYNESDAIDYLFKIRESSDEANRLFIQLSNSWKNDLIPTLGFKVHGNGIVPKKIRASDVGYDIHITTIHQKVNNLVTMYDTNVSLYIPQGYYVELHARSSLFKSGYILANSVGILDPNYTGTIKVPLYKYDSSLPDIELPYRACQLILKPYAQSYPSSVNYIPETNRGSNGFGSTIM